MCYAHLPKPPAPIEAIPLATATTVVEVEEPASEPTAEIVAAEPTAEPETKSYPAPGRDLLGESLLPGPEHAETTGSPRSPSFPQNRRPASRSIKLAVSHHRDEQQ